MLKKIFSHPFSHLLLVLALGTLAYANSFEVPFVFDDEKSILRNPVIQDLGNFLPGGSGYDFIPRRLFGYFTFALNYHFNGSDVTGYHVVNLVIHLCTALLIYALVRLTLRTPCLAGSPMHSRAGSAALLAALLFVAHPVQTQAVTYVVQRLTSLTALLYLLAIVCYAWARLSLEQGTPAMPPAGPGGAKWRVALPLGAAVAAALLAMKTKEIAFTLPLAALLYEASFFRGAWRRRLLVLLPLLLTLPLIPCSILLADNGAPADEALALEQQLRAHSEIPRLDYLFTQFRVVVTYLRLLVLPIGQNVDYDYPVFSTFFTAPVLLSGMLLAAIAALAVYLLVRARADNPDASDLDHGAAANPELSIVAFGILWFFLALSIESGLVPIADVISEHRLYLPSVGMAMAAAAAILMASQKSVRLLHGRIPLVIAGVVIIALAAATWQRNRVWESQLSLWEDVVEKAPGNGRAWYNLGTYLMGDGQLAEAARALSQATRIDPGHAEAWHNLGLVHLMNGRFREALAPLRQAVRSDPELADAEINLAIALIYSRQSAEAVRHLEKVRMTFPARPDVRYNLGVAYLEIGNLAAARREQAALASIAPDKAADLAQLLSQMTGKPAVQ